MNTGGAVPRVLLDECVPRRLRHELPGLDVSTVPEVGWASRRNGELLRLMLASGFTVFVTMDRNLAHQQNVAAAGVAVVVLRARTNRLRDLLPLMPSLSDAIRAAVPGTVSHVTS